MNFRRKRIILVFLLSTIATILVSSKKVYALDNNIDNTYTDENLLNDFNEIKDNVLEVSEEDINKYSETMVDSLELLENFIFNGSSINGITFEELTDDAKKSVEEIYTMMHTEVTSMIPGIKESFKVVGEVSSDFFGAIWETAKDKASEIIDERIPEEQQQIFSDKIHQEIEDIKTSFDVVGDVITNGLEETIDEHIPEEEQQIFSDKYNEVEENVKTFYEETKNRFTNFFKSRKK